MAVALVLDQVTLSSTGLVELHLDYTFELKISAEEARRQVHSWLVGEVSYMIRAGEPTLVISESESSTRTAFWRVPAILTATHLGDVGVAGYVDVEVETGAIGDLEHCAEQILNGGRRLAATMPSYTPKSDLPTNYLASDLKPTISTPTGSPMNILHSATS